MCLHLVLFFPVSDSVRERIPSPLEAGNWGSAGPYWKEIAWRPFVEAMGFLNEFHKSFFLQAADAPEEPAPLPVKSSDRLETDQKNQISFHQVALVYSMSQTHSNIEVCWYLLHRSRSHLVSTGWSILRSSVLGLDFLIANGKCGMAQWSLGVALGLLYPIGSSGRCSKTFKPRRGHNQRNGRTLVFWIATICTRRIP